MIRKMRRRAPIVYIRFDGEVLMIRHHYKTSYNFTHKEMEFEYYLECEYISFRELSGMVTGVREKEGVPTWERIGEL